jgi:ABC-type transporter Mla maintaining outer membrane lipid asymmetry ATPase subunit MlaF
VVTHDTHLAKKLADRVIFIRDSKIAFFGTWHEFETTSDPYLKNFRLQDELIPALDESVGEPPDASASPRPTNPPAS